MQQNGQEQQERERKPQAAAQPGREGEPASAVDQARVEQEPGSERQKLEECQDQLLRAQADFVNYRRRMKQEQAELRSAAQSALLAQILPVLDDLERALGAAPPELSEHSWVQGLFLVARRLTKVLDQLGVRRIGREGERFDPRWHEAISTEVRTDVPEGTILHVDRPGYALGERVVRPAQVVVAHAPVPLNEGQAAGGEHRGT
jgi:molecular chaperone GrpE